MYPKITRFETGLGRQATVFGLLFFLVFEKTAKVSNSTP